MAEAVGTVIPQAPEGMLQTLKDIAGYLREGKEYEETKKKQLEVLVKEEEARKKNKKIQDKLLHVYDKWFIKKRFFEKVGGSLKKMAESASGSFFKIITGLLVAAFAGGEFISSLIDMASNLIIQLIGIVSRHLPKLVKEALHIVTDILPQAFIKVVEGLAPAIGKFFFEMLKDTPLQQLGAWLQSAFGPKGALTEFLKGLAPLIPYIIGAWTAFGAATKIFGVLSKLGPLFSILSTVLGGLGSILSVVVSTLAPALAPLLPIIGVAVAIGAALALIWKYSDQILGFLDNVPKFLEDKLGIFGVILGGIFKTITLPIKIIASLFSMIKKIQSKGIVKYFKDAWKNIVKWGKDTWKSIMKSGDEILSNIKNAIVKSFKKVVDGFLNFFKPFFDKLSPVFSTVKNVLSRIYDVITGTIMKAFFKIKDTITDIIDWFGSVGEVGIWSLRKEEGRQRLDREQLIRKAARQEAFIKGGNEEQIVKRMRTEYSAKDDNKAVVDAIKQLESRVAKQQAQVNAKRFGSSPTNTQGKR